eukprot:7927682-Lingulodinium_polyedra.AAC.1
MASLFQRAACLQYPPADPIWGGGHGENAANVSRFQWAACLRYLLQTQSGEVGMVKCWNCQPIQWAACLQYPPADPVSETVNRFQ